MQAKPIVLTVLMALASAAAVKLTPQPMFPKDYRPAVTLEQLVPASFGDWSIDPMSGNQVVNPAVAAHVATIYTDVLSRTYIDKAGNRVMLSLAYGADQGRASQVHKPEVCYQTQGFALGASQKADLVLDQRHVPVMHLVAKSGPRTEPITYWIRTGDYVVRGWLEQNTARVRNGLLKGVTPDGVLVRVSTIDTDPAHAFAVQAAFLDQLIRGANRDARVMLWGAELEGQHVATAK